CLRDVSETVGSRGRRPDRVWNGHRTEPPPLRGRMSADKRRPPPTRPGRREKGAATMRTFALIALAAAGVTLLALFAGRLAPSSGNASSHREAPLISEDPTADTTDLYAFRSPDKPDTLTIIANWIP